MLRNIKISALVAFALALPPVLSYAYALDLPLDCRSSAHAFIAPLLEHQYIDPQPMHVETNSVNAFRPVHGSNLTAFGFRVYAVLGFEPDDALFKRGSGQPLPGSPYGVVVRGSAEAVAARTREAGSNATVHQVIPLVLSVIFCDGR